MKETTRTNAGAMEGTGGAKDLCLELRILDAFAACEAIALGPTDLEKILGVSKGTISPRLKAMAEAGFLAALGGGRYTLGAKVTAIYLRHLGRLASKIDETERLVSETLGPFKAVMREMMLAGKGGEA